MANFIGIDEAGYGPNLGPLVVGATAWRGSEVGGQRSGARSDVDSLSSVDLYERLRGIVSAEADDGCVAIADSKVLFKSGGGLRLLERGVLTGLGMVGRFCVGGEGEGGEGEGGEGEGGGVDGEIAEGGDASARWGAFWESTGADAGGRRLELPWCSGFDCALPIDADVGEIVELQEMFRRGCETASVQLCDMQARAVFPCEFNELTEHYGTKGAALSHISIALLKEVLENPDLRPLTPDPCYITCDKHGGRNHYGALLQHHFPDEWIETLQESRPMSRYRWGPPESRVTVTFRTRGEEELPTALASMVAKYHRELAMRAFNAYWAVQVADLRPTAGYPQDAKRFRAEIAVRQRELGIDDRLLWRNR